MPNIEIHCQDLVRSRQIRTLIFEALESRSYADEIVISLFKTQVTNLRKEKLPFIRVYSDEQSYLDDLVKELSALLGWYIEVLILSRFISATTR